MARAFLGIGSNLGDAASHVRGAVSALTRLGAVRLESSLYASEPWGVLDQPGFVNAVVQIETELGPHALLDELKAIERELGRVESVRWGPRVIDIDILLYDDLAVTDERLQIPHPRMRERAFVLTPLAEIDAQFVAWRDELSPDERAQVQVLETR